MLAALRGVPAAPAELWRFEGPWEPSLSAGFGYSHYQAKELNEVLVLLEHLTRESAGLNPYEVKGFDGHPAAQAALRLRRGPWTAALEVEFWTESFAQSEVPFDLGDNDREDRITCDDLRATESDLSGLAGCIEARESFVFLPTTLQLSWAPRWTPWLRAGGGYALGVLAGSARIELSAEYFGAGAAPDDRVTFSVEPDPLVNPVHKFFATAEWTPSRWFGLELRSGWRITKLGGFTVRNLRGSSQVFDAAFDYPKDGDQLWIRWTSVDPDRRSIWIGSREEAESVSSRFGHQLVQGDFSGWFASLSAVVSWGAP